MLIYLNLKSSCCHLSELCSLFPLTIPASHYSIRRSPSEDSCIFHLCTQSLNLSLNLPLSQKSTTTLKHFAFLRQMRHGQMPQPLHGRCYKRSTCCMPPLMLSRSVLLSVLLSWCLSVPLTYGIHSSPCTRTHPIPTWGAKALS